MAFAIPPPDFAHGFWSLREKGPVDRADAAVDEIGKYREQRRQHQDHCKHGHSGHDVVGDAAPQGNGRHGVQRGTFWSSQAFALEGWPRVTVQTSKRASALTTIVTRNRARPISMSDER